MAIAAPVWLWRHFPLGLVALIGITLAFARNEIREHRRVKNQGYWVEYLSPGQVRAADDDFAVVYHEGERWHFFDGKEHPAPASNILTVPSPAAWPTQVPDWMRDRRDVILERMTQELSRARTTRPIRIAEDHGE